MIIYENGVFTNQRIGGALETRPVLTKGTNYLVGAGQTVITAISGYIIRVIYMRFSPSGAAIVTWKSDANPLTGNETFLAAGYYENQFNPTGMLETNIGEALKIDVTTNTIGLSLRYIAYLP